MVDEIASASGTQPTSLNERVARHRMPKPGERNAPVFDPDKPEELGRFFDRVEDWFLDEGIIDDEERKKRIVKYLDADSEVQWKALSKFTTGSFVDFKAQVMSSYPAAEEVMKGSVTALKRKIKKIGPVMPDDRDELLSLVRIMTAKIMKLKKITPPIHTNRELVDLFLGRLSPDFASRVATKLTVHRLIDARQPEQANPVRNPEDMYDIEEVMEMAKHTSLEQANPFGKFLTTGATQVVPGAAKLEEAVARLTDSINIQTQHNKAVDQRLHVLQSFVNQPKPAYQDYGSNRATYGERTMNAIAQLLCFYCNGPHRMGDCEHVNKHLELGWIKKIEGRLRLENGNKLPKESGLSTKESVEAHCRASKPGLIPMSKIQDKASLYQGGASSYAQVAERSEDLEAAQAMHEVFRVVGIDRVREYLQGQSETLKEAEEWEQNFD